VKTEPKLNQTYYISHSVMVFHLSVTFSCSQKSSEVSKSSITCHSLGVCMNVCICVCVCVCMCVTSNILCSYSGVAKDSILFYVTTFRPVNTDVSKYRSSFTFRDKGLKLSVLGLLGTVHKDSASFRNVRPCLLVDHDYYRYSELQECMKRGSRGPG
jgi:hypothetical protein